MAKYVVQWSYRSSLGGPFLKNDVVEVSEALAEAINRDSPGVLAPQKPTPSPLPKGKGKKETEPVDEQVIRDRMVRQAATHGRKPGEVMTSANFGAVAPKEE